MYNAERGLFDLRRGRILRVRPATTGPAEPTDPSDDLVIAVDGLDDRGLERIRDLAGGPARLVVTMHRARLLGWCSESTDASSGAVSIELSPSDGAADVLRLSAARRSTGVPSDVRGADDADLRVGPAGSGGSAALALARLGRMLPAVVVAPVGSTPTEALSLAIERGAVLETAPGEILEYVDAARSEIVRVSEAPVPIPDAEASRFVLFREACGLEEHVAVLVGDRSAWPDPVPIRLHSACLTGDLFGSLRCDCGEQLRGSMEYFAARGGGILLYLAQEGRGIGLGNKFRAYSLQETGLDTIEADGTLGFGADERDYDIAIRILRDLGVSSVELLTNNPLKVRALEQGGIAVVRRQPLFGHLNRHNLPYVRAKADRAGHWLRDMLSQPMAGD